MSDSLTITGPTLEQRIAATENERALMDQFIQRNLSLGVDYEKPFRGAGKPTLLKAGSEKVLLLLNLMPVFEVDKDTHGLLSDAARADTICYRCKLVDRNTQREVADGRGACSIKEKQGNVNTAIKMAEKRAQLDATLRVAALSDRFTQDMGREDKPREEAKPVPAKPIMMMSPSQKQTIDNLCTELNATVKTDGLNYQQANVVINQLIGKRKQLAAELDATAAKQ